MDKYCEDKECEYYGSELVDLGYGCPVCRSQLAMRYPVPLEEQYKNKGFEKWYKIVKCNEGKPRRK